jgi:hypothetical protein
MMFEFVGNSAKGYPDNEDSMKIDSYRPNYGFEPVLRDSHRSIHYDDLMDIQGSGRSREYALARDSANELSSSKP